MSVDLEIKIEQIPISKIHIDNEFNCRGKIDPIDVAALVSSIREVGLMQPVTVREYSQKQKEETGYPYGLVAGYRRITAYKCLNYPVISAHIKYDLNDIDARFLNLEENVNREDLNILQEAKSLEKLKNAGITMKSIADRLGKSITWVQIRFNVLNFPESIQEECAKGVLAQTHIQQITRLPRDKQAEAVKKIKGMRARGEKGITVAVKAPITSEIKKARSRAEMSKMLDHIYQVFGPSKTTRVLAWAIGNISSLELFNHLKEEAKEIGKYYEIPEEEF